ncbi:cold-shock protein [Streptomyces sp. SGAir0957]
MARGTVKWFNSERGCGFIVLESNDTDVFVAAEAVPDRLPLIEGEAVTFNIADGPRRPVAEDVMRLDQEAGSTPGQSAASSRGPGRCSGVLGGQAPRG